MSAETEGLMSGTTVTGTVWRVLTEEEQSLLREAVRRVFTAIDQKLLPALELPEKLEPRSSLAEEVIHYIARKLVLQESTVPGNRFIKFVIDGTSLLVDESVSSVRGRHGDLTFVLVAMLLFLTLKGYEFILPELRLNVRLKGGWIYSLPQ